MRGQEQAIPLGMGVQSLIGGQKGLRTIVGTKVTLSQNDKGFKSDMITL